MTDHGEREDLGRSVDATGLGCAARAGAAPRDERALKICRAVWPIFHPGAKYDGWSHWPNGRDLLDAVERALSPAPAASGGGETLKFLAAVIAGICTYGSLDAHDREVLTKALARHKAASSGAPAASPTEGTTIISDVYNTGCRDGEAATWEAAAKVCDSHMRSQGNTGLHAECARILAKMFRDRAAQQGAAT